jgi:hypothetical protein
MCSKVRTRNFGGAALLRTNKSLKTPQVSTFGPLLRTSTQIVLSPSVSSRRNCRKRDDRKNNIPSSTVQYGHPILSQKQAQLMTQQVLAATQSQWRRPHQLPLLALAQRVSLLRDFFRCRWLNKTCNSKSKFSSGIRPRRLERPKQHRHEPDRN